MAHIIYDFHRPQCLHSILCIQHPYFQCYEDLQAQRQTANKVTSTSGFTSLPNKINNGRLPPGKILQWMGPALQKGDSTLAFEGARIGPCPVSHIFNDLLIHAGSIWCGSLPKRALSSA